MTWMFCANSGRISWSTISMHKMYNEFRSLALDDSSARRASNRLNGLIHFFYDASSSNGRVSFDDIQDLVDLVRENLRVGVTTLSSTKWISGLEKPQKY